MEPSRLLSTFLIFVIFISCHPKGEVFEEAYCIENISIIDPEKGLIENQTVIVKEGKIHKVVPSNQIQLSAENEIIDGTGKFLMPGLWDAHMHFAYIESLAPSMFDLFLAYGITSVRDTGGRMEFVKKWKDASLANPTEAPRVMIAGPLLDGTPNVYDGRDPGHPPLSVRLGSESEIEKKVNELDSLGIDFLKAYEMLSIEQFMTIMRLAKEKGLKVTGHIPLSMDVISASNAGLNSMEHIRNVEFSFASNADELLLERRKILENEEHYEGAALRTQIHQMQRIKAIDNYDEKKASEVLEILAKNDTWQIPTLTLAKAYSTRYFADADWQESFNALPDTIATAWENEIGIIMKEPVPSSGHQYSKWFLNIVGKMHQADIPIMAGTDSPIFFLTPGRSLHQELALLVEVGLTPLEAIKTATINPAKYFDLDNEIGHIEENMWADMVVLDANPLENIANTRRISAVIKQGKFLDRKALDKLLQCARNPEIKKDSF
ncbi:amidohydrolase family protein [Maribacter halichondriae]|uniref:amidohydrolase family protein n=1 Tax=Maribacter halichondriae TaxID=2980554 RepID=UPI0023592F9B|nr:amidohydrolase family protein [Maribacter sp. Hal144]